MLGDELDEEIKAEAAELMRAGIAAAEAEPPADVGLVFEHAAALDPPAVVSSTTSPSCGGSSSRVTARLAQLRRAARDLMLVEAVNDALHAEMERDENVLVMGEDVGRAGGVFRATAGLRDRFGPDRCVDTPLAEAGILGSAVGLCMAGFRPVCEMQYDAFSYPCLDQLITHVGRYRWRTGGTMTFPLTIRMPYGGGVRAPELHDDSPETYYVHTPGIKVAIPSTPADAKGLAGSSDPRPGPGRRPRAEARLPHRARRGARGRARRPARARRGSSAREATSRSSRMARWCRSASAPPTSSTRSVEVLDLRSLKPLDEEALLASAAKTGRVVLVQEAPRTCGYAAELAAILAEKALLDLRGAGRARDRATTSRTRTGRSRTPTCPRSRASSTRPGGCSSF